MTDTSNIDYAQLQALGQAQSMATPAATLIEQRDHIPESEARDQLLAIFSQSLDHAASQGYGLPRLISLDYGDVTYRIDIESRAVADA